MQIQDFIKQLGLDSINPDTFEASGKTKEKRTKLKKVASNLKTPTLLGQNSASVSDGISAKGKYSEFKQNKFQNKNSAFQEAPTFIQPTQNKKIIFDNTYIAKNPVKDIVKIAPPAPIIHKNENKKIIFDEDYISKPSTDNSQESYSASDDSWYHLLIKPDIPWYQQDKPLKTNGEVSPEAVRQCEEEGKKYLEEDAINYQKGTFNGNHKMLSLLKCFIV